MSEKDNRVKSEQAEDPKTSLLRVREAAPLVARAVAIPSALAVGGFYVGHLLLSLVLGQAILLAGMVIVIYLLFWFIWEFQKASRHYIRDNHNYVGLREAIDHQASRVHALETAGPRNLQGLFYGPWSRRLPEGCFEVYLEYSDLSVQHLGELLKAIDGLHRVVVGLLLGSEAKPQRRWRRSIESVAPLHDFLVGIDDSLRGNPDERLLIGHCRTGESIRIVVVPGWFPNLDVDDGDLVVGLPKRGSSVLLTGYLLSSIVSHGASTLNDATSALKNHRELAKIELEVEKIEGELANSPGDICMHADRIVKDIRAQTVRHPETSYLTVKTSRD